MEQCKACSGSGKWRVKIAMTDQVRSEPCERCWGNGSEVTAHQAATQQRYLDALLSGAADPLLYLAGPIAVAPRVWYSNAIAYAHRLHDQFKEDKITAQVFVPHVCVPVHERHPREPEEWLAFDGAILARADALIVLPRPAMDSQPTHSDGRAAEFQLCRGMGIPILYNYAEIFEFIRGFQERNGGA